jgi:alkanesulfonate monooxygenase SsuD/methylene tetrahydromethanopterin reductase-like flavin-dependent oxidoreductase (luciferase family)
MAHVASLRWEDLIQEVLLIGSPATVRAQVQALQDVGVGELGCWMSFGGLPPDKVRRSMELFAREVIPAFRAAPMTAGER